LSTPFLNFFKKFFDVLDSDKKLNYNTFDIYVFIDVIPQKGSANYVPDKSNVYPGHIVLRKMLPHRRSADHVGYGC
jgi:hypothetical protein